MRTHELPGTHSGGLVAVAMLLVVASFSASLWYSHWLVQSIDEEALVLAGDTIPSVEQLSAIRVALRGAAMHAIQCVVGPCDGGSVRAHLSSARRSRDEALRALERLPASAEEADALRALRAQLAGIDEPIDRTVAEAMAGSTDAAATLLRDSLQPRLAAAERAIEDLQAWNARQAKTVTDRIIGIRARAMWLTVWLGVASIAIALIATALVLRILRGRQLLVRQNALMLEERSRELEAFAGRVAHDLRDPLNALSLQVRVLAGASGREALSEQVSRGVLRQLERMRRVIDGLLEFARQGAGTGSAGADLSEVLDDVVGDVRARAEAAGVSLRVEPFAPARLACSPGALQSVLANLLGNAIKYVVEGRRDLPVVTVRILAQSDSVRVEVADNGPGMPPGSEARVFEPFRRLEGTSQPGVGLGLATVKKIVETYRGRVGVDSELGKGSLFWFELPKWVEAPQSLTL
jgi:signal transduction histidine kinase